MIDYPTSIFLHQVHEIYPELLSDLFYRIQLRCFVQSVFSNDSRHSSQYSVLLAATVLMFSTRNLTERKGMGMERLHAGTWVQHTRVLDCLGTGSIHA